MSALRPKADIGTASENPLSRSTRVVLVFARESDFVGQCWRKKNGHPFCQMIDRRHRGHRQRHQPEQLTVPSQMVGGSTITPYLAVMAASFSMPGVPAAVAAANSANI